MIEVGRHKGIVKTQRYCPFCQNQDVEDEIHFLITCPTFNILRNNTLSNYEKGIISHPFITVKEKFVSLMQDPTLSLAKFIHKGFELREFLVLKHKSFIWNPKTTRHPYHRAISVVSTFLPFSSIVFIVFWSIWPRRVMPYIIGVLSKYIKLKLNTRILLI